MYSILSHFNRTANLPLPIAVRLNWLWAVALLVLAAGVWPLYGSSKGGQEQADDLRVEIMQHIEVNRYTLHLPLTSQGSRPVELNDYGVAIVKVTGRAGQRVRVLLGAERSMQSDKLNRGGNDLSFDLQVAWLEGEESFRGNGWSRAEKVSNQTEFTVQLSSYVSTEWSLPRPHEAEWESQKSEHGGALKKVPIAHYDAPTRALNSSQEVGTAIIFIKPVMKPDGKQHPGRFLADITVRAEYDDAFIFDRGGND